MISSIFSFLIYVYIQILYHLSERFTQSKIAICGEFKYYEASLNNVYWIKSFRVGGRSKGFTDMSKLENIKYLIIQGDSIDDDGLVNFWASGMKLDDTLDAYEKYNNHLNVQLIFLIEKKTYTKSMEKYMTHLKKVMNNIRDGKYKDLIFTICLVYNKEELTNYLQELYKVT